MSQGNLSEPIGAVVAELRAQPWSLGIALVREGRTEVHVDAGSEGVGASTHFQLGSVTKTITGLLLADLVAADVASLDTTVGDVLDDDGGNCVALTLGDLATQHSGLPRLPPNFDPRKVDRHDPYAKFNGDDLLQALTLVEKPTPTYGYSNFGFMLLAYLLARIAGRSYSELCRERIFEPLDMTGAMVGVPPEPRLPGHHRGAAVGWWNNPVPGSGGVSCGIQDLARYVAAAVSAPPSMAEAWSLALATHRTGPPEIGLGWVCRDGVHFHNGATGGFRSFVAVNRQAGAGVGLLVNSADLEAVDQAGMALLADVSDGHS